MKPMRVVLLIAGIVVAIVALSLVAAGGLLVWEHTTQRDDDGFYSTDPERLESPSYALVSDVLDLGTPPGDWIPSDIATIRIASRDAVFIGVAPRADVRRYLRGVAHTEVTDFSTDPFRPTYDQIPGEATPTTPDAEDFWAAMSSDGTLTWDVEGGEWSVVLMNADASRGIDTDVSFAVKSGLILPAGIVALVLGLLIGVGAVAMIRASTRRERQTLAPGTTPARPDAPATPPPP